MQDLKQAFEVANWNWVGIRSPKMGALDRTLQSDLLYEIVAENGGATVVTPYPDGTVKPICPEGFAKDAFGVCQPINPIGIVQAPEDTTGGGTSTGIGVGTSTGSGTSTSTGSGTTVGTGKGISPIYPSGGGSSSGGSGTSTNTPTSTSSTQPKDKKWLWIGIGGGILLLVILTTLVFNR